MHPPHQGRHSATFAEPSKINKLKSDRLLAQKDDPNWKDERGYQDYRKMLAKHIDAVIVGMPDHHHFPATALAMVAGKHVFTRKLLTHTVLEARQLQPILHGPTAIRPPHDIAHTLHRRSAGNGSSLSRRASPATPSQGKG